MDDVSEDREWPSRDSLDFLDEIYHMVVQDVLVEGSKGDGKVVDYLSPEELTNKLDLQVVQEGTKWKDLVEECKKVIRYSIKTSRPAHMNTLLARIDMAALAGSWITDALNNTQTTFDAAPAFIVVEKYLIRELTKLVGFPDGDGIFVPGSSFGNIMAVHLARYRYNKDIKEKGMFGMPRLCIFCSEEAHYSAKKAANFLGFGTDSIVSVKTEDGRMIPAELEGAITACLKMGNIPLIVVATSGTTVLGGFDPLVDIVNICRNYKLWVHVDAAWGAPVIFSKQHRNLLSGLDQCDSVVWSLHKQLGAINQCSVLLTRENGLLMKCNSSNASYLFAQDKHYDTSFDIGDKTVQCGRKIDAFKFWMLWKSRGMVGMEKHVDRSFENTSYLVEKLKSREGFRLVPTSIQYINVCFWYIPVRLRGVPETNDWWREIYEVAPRIKAKMAHTGSMWITYQPLESRGFGNFFRIIVHEQCGKKDLDFILDEFEKLGHDL